nr:hypothetical protein [Tanacetum cinerariifolium]
MNRSIWELTFPIRVSHAHCTGLPSNTPPESYSAASHFGGVTEDLAIILEMTLSSILKASGNSLICRCGPLVVVVIVVVIVIVVGVSSSASTISGYMASPFAVGAFGTTWSIMVEVAFRA